MTEAASPQSWLVKTQRLSLDRTLLMGVLNVTPDSFSDGGRYREAGEAVEHGLALLEDGADIIDVGGESTRPGAVAVSEDEELERVGPVVQQLVREGAVVSIDTMKAEVAREAVALGAEIINDVSGFRHPAMVEAAARTRAGLVVVHMLGEPRTMQVEPAYDDVVEDVARYLDAQAELLVSAGVAEDRIVVDPGIGFGKTLEHNLDLLRGLSRFGSSGRPVLVGPSRKRFLGVLTEIDDPDARDVATAASAVLAIRAGASIVRAHNVGLLRGAVQVADAIVRSTWRSRD